MSCLAVAAALFRAHTQFYFLANTAAVTHLAVVGQIILEIIFRSPSVLELKPYFNYFIFWCGAEGSPQKAACITMIKELIC